MFKASFIDCKPSVLGMFVYSADTSIVTSVACEGNGSPLALQVNDTKYEERVIYIDSIDSLYTNITG